MIRDLAMWEFGLLRNDLNMYLSEPVTDLQLSIKNSSQYVKASLAQRAPSYFSI
jgi:hypothetical protein